MRCKAGVRVEDLVFTGCECAPCRANERCVVAEASETELRCDRHQGTHFPLQGVEHPRAGLCDAPADDDDRRIDDRAYCSDTASGQAKDVADSTNLSIARRYAAPPTSRSKGPESPLAAVVD